MITNDGSVLVTEDLGRSWSDPIRLPPPVPSQTDAITELEDPASSEAFAPFVAICDSGQWIVTQGDRAFIGSAGERSSRAARGALPGDAAVGGVPPLCDTRNRFWLFGEQEIFVITSQTRQSRLSARFSVSAAAAAALYPVQAQVLVPTLSGVLWFAADDHLGRTGVAHSRPLIPLTTDPKAGGILGVWSGHLWRLPKEGRPEDLGPVPEGTTSLVVDREGQIWCLANEGVWWRRRGRGFAPTNVAALAVDASGRLLSLSAPGVGRTSSTHVPVSLRRRAPGAILDDPGPFPCNPLSGYRFYIRIRGDWRTGGRADVPPDAGAFASFQDGGAAIGLFVGIEASPTDRGACMRRLESWSRRQRQKIFKQAHLLEALLQRRYDAAQASDPRASALKRLDVERIERLLSVVERGTVQVGSRSSQGEDL